MRNSQTISILNHLKKAPITPLEALEKYGCFRLGARIFDLKQEGYNINKKMVSSNGKTFAKYSLNSEPVRVSNE